ncbi:hypothetical protein [Sphingomonas sp. R1]|uniref:hypothetical protein n=1 Tax=Sphingomonas sp. R1 TaxID=399176 RepID=UPI00222424E8|nr:hypothetical protein [Sphingomonas sp. R1]UYY77478.1 hypothetical protein OIM94_00245 [Sphingomonas sp. R1]
MDLNDVQRAAIKLALAKLDSDREHKHEMALIKRLIGEVGAKQVQALYREYVQANKDARKNGGALLSPDAADYWQEAQATLAYGAMVYANPSNGGYGNREKALSRKCEELGASFSSRVPQNEQGKFRQYVDGDPDHWDDRWHNTRDGFFPLLDASFSSAVPVVSNAMGEAQRIVLYGVLDQEQKQERSRNVQRITHCLDRFREERSAQELKLTKAAANARKAAEKAKKESERKAAIERGDQKATKAKRARGFQVVGELFDIPAERRGGAK